MQTLRSILFTILLFVSVVPYSLAVIAVRPFGSAASFRVGMTWVHLIIGACKALCRLDFTVEGAENLPAKNCVVYMKHSSAYETIAQMLVIPQQSWVLKRELIWTPFLGWALACLYPIPIDRGAHAVAVAQIIKKGCARLAEGLWVVIFPEGTRMGAGETRRYGISGVLLAQKSNSVILPIAHNAGDFWPRRGWQKRPGTVRFVFGPPVNPAGREPREVNTEIQNWMESKVAEIRR